MPGKTLEFTVKDDCAGTRLDRCLSRLIAGSSRAYLQKLIKEGLVKCGTETLTLPRYPVRSGMTICVTLPEVSSGPPAPEPFAFEILYEDDAMLVIDKPAGVVVHPAAGNPAGTVVNALLGRYPQMAQTFSLEQSRPGIVHRLDKDTSGCLVIAKTPDAQFRLGNAFAEHTTHKTYLAVLRGVPKTWTGDLTTLIGRHPVNRQKMAVVERNGKNAVTHYRILVACEVQKVPLALAEVRIETGRTHQIRVHMAHLGLPVLGDEVYNRHPAFPGVTRQLLHAWRITLPHPVTNAELCCTAPVPEDMRQIFRQMKNAVSGRMAENLEKLLAETAENGFRA